MDAKTETIELLRNHGAVLLRTKKHNIYRLRDGVKFVLPASPSDHHSWANCLSDLKIRLGLSRRGTIAVVGSPENKPHRKRQPRQNPYASIPASPIAFNFAEKVRAALKGEKLVHKVAASISTSKPNDATLTGHGSGRKRGRREQTEQHGIVRQWSKAEIEAANAAMRHGKFTDFMQEYNRARNPLIQPTEETMLTVETMQSTIDEFEAGMSQALEEQKSEDAAIMRLQSEIEAATQRRLAAMDRYNTLNRFKTDLSVLRDDLEKVRPMLGHLAKKPTPFAVPSDTRPKLKDIVRTVLKNSDHPLSAREIHDAAVQLGAEFTPSSVFTFFSLEKKKNGASIVREVGANRYVLSQPPA